MARCSYIICYSQTVVYAAKKKPHLKVMCGFSRRFDDSYRDAWIEMESGLIGRPSIFRSKTCDKLEPSGFFVAYAEFSGAIFVDYSFHDIDLALWFFGQDSMVKPVVASGPSSSSFVNTKITIVLLELSNSTTGRLRTCSVAG
jgi:predicted dehydrogenase